MRVLLLGGTAEARELASVLVGAGHDVTSSLAGRVSAPRLPAGAVRIGGFGGVPGLVDYLTTHPMDAVVDATHPFAERITSNAFEACAQAHVPFVRLSRASWRDHPRAGQWVWVEDHPTAARTATHQGSRIWLTVGRQELAHYAAMQAERVVARVADASDIAIPPSWRLVVDRGPFTFEEELALIDAERVDVLVSKDSGTAATSAKLDAAAARGVTVVMMERPAPPSGLLCLPDGPAVRAWLAERSDSRPT